MADYTLTPEIREIRTNVRAFMDEHVYPNEEIIEEGPPEHFFSAPTHERTRQFLSKIL